MAGIGITRVADCPVCLGTFKDPRVLPCGHTFCLICIKEYGRGKYSESNCPNCRAKFHIPSNSFESLPKNYCLNQVLDESTNVVNMRKSRVVKRLCKKHKGEELVLYCVQCSQVICLDCMEIDHRKHDCCKISGFAKEARTQLECYVKSIQPILSQVTSQKSQVEEESKKFRSVLDTSELAINKECDSIIQLVNSQRRLLLEKLNNEKQRVTRELKMKSDEIEAVQLRLESFNAQIEKMLQGTDAATTFDIVSKGKDFKKSFDELKHTQPQSIGQVQVDVKSIEFIPGDFKDFIIERENVIGRLHMESDCKYIICCSSTDPENV